MSIVFLHYLHIYLWRAASFSFLKFFSDSSSFNDGENVSVHRNLHMELDSKTKVVDSELLTTTNKSDLARDFFFLQEAGG